MSISDNVQRLQTELKGLSLPKSFELLAVSKKASITQIREAYAAGLRSFGESYWQEAIPKLKALTDLDLVWYFIGRLQSNKCQSIAEHFSWVMGLSHLRHARALNSARSQSSPLNVCVQINVDRETQKDGVDLKDLSAFITAIQALPHLRLRGFMLIPAINSPNGFEQAAVLFKQWQSVLGPDFDTLSMGMSGDYRHALAAGSTMIRVGSLLFRSPVEKMDHS